MTETAAKPKARAAKPGNGVPPAAVEPEEVKLVESEDESKVLDLTLAPTRRLVKIPTKAKPEGEPFYLRLLDDFGIGDQQQLLAWSRQFEQLWNQAQETPMKDGKLVPSLDADQQLVMKLVLDAMFDRVLDAPEEIKADTPDSIRSRVVTAFTLAPLLAQQEAEQEAAEEKEKNAALSTSES